MNMTRRIKNNLFVRNIWFFVERVKSMFKGKWQFAQCGDNVIITPPMSLIILKIFIWARV